MDTFLQTCHHIVFERDAALMVRKPSTHSYDYCIICHSNQL